MVHESCGATGPGAASVGEARDGANAVGVGNGGGDADVDRPMPRLLLAAGLVLLSSGCRNQDEEGAIALWEDFQAADYRSWARAPGPSRMSLRPGPTSALAPAASPSASRTRASHSVAISSMPRPGRSSVNGLTTCS